MKILAFLCVFFRHSKIFLPIPWNELSFSWITYTPAWGGVWIFFLLSGYGIGKGYWGGKYNVDVCGIIDFYYSRLKKLLPIYWFYIVLVACFVDTKILIPSIEHMEQLISLFFFSYAEDFDPLEYGLAWYLTTLIRLYVTVPFIYYFLRKYLQTNMDCIKFLVVILLAGCMLRILSGYCYSFSGMKWNSNIYPLFYYNLDIFYSGFIFSKMKINFSELRDKHIYVLQALSTLLILGVIIGNSYIYYVGEFCNISNYMYIYCYLGPTVYITVLLLYIATWEYNNRSNNKMLLLWSKCVNSLSRILYPAYLFHAAILMCICRNYDINNYASILNFFSVEELYVNTFVSCFLTMNALLATVAWSYVVIFLFKKV